MILSDLIFLTVVHYQIFYITLHLIVHDVLYFPFSWQNFHVLKYIKVMLLYYWVSEYLITDVTVVLFWWWRSAAKRQRTARSVDVKPVAAVQHSPGSAGVMQTTSPSKNTSPGATASAVNRQKRPPPLHINGNHSSALVRVAENHIIITLFCLHLQCDYTLCSKKRKPPNFWQ